MREKYIILFKSTKTVSPTSNTRAASLPLTGDSSIYLKNGINHGQNVSNSLEGTDFIRIGNITFYHNRISDPTSILRSMGQFWIH